MSSQDFSGPDEMLTHKKSKKAKSRESAERKPHAEERLVKRAKKEENKADEREDGGEVQESKEPSKRELRRRKMKEREALQKQIAHTETTQKALQYLFKWKNSRSEWKFEKLKQIWLMDHLLDDNAIGNDAFPTVIEYFEGCKGMAREQLLKKCTDAIKKQEEKEEAGTENIEKSVEYERARQLLQALPTET